MSTSCSKPLCAKIALGIGGFSFVVFFVCLVVGSTLFIQEYHKMSLYEQESCRVTSASYEGSDRYCTRNGKHSTYRKCYTPVWQVEFGQNGTRKGTIRGYPEGSLDGAMIASDKYQVPDSYPCWYNTKKSAELTWYKPNTSPSIILIIIGAIAAPFAIISFIIYCRFREHPDL